MPPCDRFLDEWSRVYVGMPEPLPFSGHNTPAVLEVEPKVIWAIREGALTGFDSPVTVNLLERDALSNAIIVPRVSSLTITIGDHTTCCNRVGVDPSSHQNGESDHHGSE